MITLSWEMGGLFFSFANCLCLVIQFAFANKLYLRWCSCPDTCCRTLVAKRTKRDIPIKSLSPSHSMVLSVSASTSPGILTPASSAGGVAPFSMSASVTQRCYIVRMEVHLIGQYSRPGCKLNDNSDCRMRT